MAAAAAAGVPTVLKCWAVLLLLALPCTRAASLSQKTTFNARPNVPDVAQISLDDVECIFSYSVVGGSSEEWEITLSKDAAGKQYTCTIERPNSPSYLFYQAYTAKLNLPVETAEVWSANKDNNGALLRGDQFEVKEHSCENSPGWNGVLRQITLSASKKGPAPKAKRPKKKKGE